MVSGPMDFYFKNLIDAAVLVAGDMARARFNEKKGRPTGGQVKSMSEARSKRERKRLKNLKP